MPKEKFYFSDQAEGDGRSPDVTVAWGERDTCIYINDLRVDRSAVNRLIRVLRKARDQVYGADD